MVVEIASAIFKDLAALKYSLRTEVLEYSLQTHLDELLNRF